MRPQIATTPAAVQPGQVAALVKGWAFNEPEKVAGVLVAAGLAETFGRLTNRAAKIAAPAGLPAQVAAPDRYMEALRFGFQGDNKP